MKKLLRISGIVVLIYVFLCAMVYFFQENLIFFPEKLKADYQFDFPNDHSSINIRADDGKILHGVLFTTQNSKGLIFYLHGNAGSIRTWGHVAETYNLLDYDVFLIDYRGYGKSEGSITSEQQVFSDIQATYDHMKTMYSENKIIVLGYSIGTGPATKVASENDPKELILQAPYYSLIDMMDHRFPILPKFLLKYKFETNKYITDCKMPITLFHGTDDNLIPYESSLRLRKLLKKSDTLIMLDGVGHNGMTDNDDYKMAITGVLKN